MDKGIVNVKAIAVHDNKNGTFSIEIPVKPLSAAEMKMMETLFPNLKDAAHRLLNQEAFLSCMASESDLMAPPVQETTQKSKYASDSRIK